MCAVPRDYTHLYYHYLAVKCMVIDVSFILQQLKMFLRGKWQLCTTLDSSFLCHLKHDVILVTNDVKALLERVTKEELESHIKMPQGFQEFQLLYLE